MSLWVRPSDVRGQASFRVVALATAVASPHVIWIGNESHTRVQRAFFPEVTDGCPARLSTQRTLGFPRVFSRVVHPTYPEPTLLQGAENSVDVVDFELFIGEAVLAVAGRHMNL